MLTTVLPDEMPQKGDDDSEECENMTEVLDVRKMRILQAIVDDYSHGFAGRLKNFVKA